MSLAGSLIAIVRILSRTVVRSEGVELFVVFVVMVVFIGGATACAYETSDCIFKFGVVFVGVAFLVGCCVLFDLFT
jgi:hypothetical protein